MTFQQFRQKYLISRERYERIMEEMEQLVYYLLTN